MDAGKVAEYAPPKSCESPGSIFGRLVEAAARSIELRMYVELNVRSCVWGFFFRKGRLIYDRPLAPRSTPEWGFVGGQTRSPTTGDRKVRRTRDAAPSTFS